MDSTSSNYRRCHRRGVFSILLLPALAAFSSLALANNSVGYVPVKEVKTWAAQVDVYLIDDQVHQCTNAEHPMRFLLDPANRPQVATLLTAFASGRPVSLSYTCRTDGHPQINGIRVR